jgi:hypothetical protein
MKFRQQVALWLLLFASLSPLGAQSSAESPTFPRVLFVHGHDHVLLIFDKNRQAYEVPGVGAMTGGASFKSYFVALARDLGVSYKSPRLGGIFTYVSEGKSVISPYFVAEFDGYLNGERLANREAKWFPLSEALKEIKYPASAMIVERIMKDPGTVWGASFEESGYTNPIDPAKITFRVIEQFYRLNGE